MAKKKLTKSKAKEMLHNPPYGKSLSDKQRKYFSAVANAQAGLSVIDTETPAPKKRARIIANSQYPEFAQEYERTKGQYAKHYPGGVEFIEARGYDELEKAFGSVAPDEDLIMMAHHNPNSMYGVDVANPSFGGVQSPQDNTLAGLFSGLENRGYKGNCYLGICEGTETAKSLQGAGVNIPIFGTPEGKKWYGANPGAKGSFEDFFFGVGKPKNVTPVDYSYGPGSSTRIPADEIRYAEEMNTGIPINPELGKDYLMNISPRQQELMARRASGTPVTQVKSLNYGGIINDNRGQLAHPGKITKINSNNITMKGVKTPLLGISNTGQKQIMLPEQDYLFDGSSVTEIPLAKSGIHIKKENRGLLHENLGVPKGEKIPASKLKIKSTDSPAVKKRKQFAINAKKFKHKEGGFLGELDNQLEGIGGIAGATGNLIQGIQIFGQERKNKKQAEQFLQLSQIVGQAAGLPPDLPQRRYVRPEDNLVNPGELYSPYGTGTNYLAKDGKKIPSYQNGNPIDLLTGISGEGNEGNVGNMLGSLIGGGKGQQSGAGKIGSTVGGVAGSFLGPLGSVAGSFIGGAIGGVIGGNAQKQAEMKQQQAYQQLQAAAFQQGSQQIHNQYSAFMKNGGKMNTGGELQVYDGNAELISQNPYLPGGGQTVMFNGPSHTNGGMDIRFGGTDVEVEGGEPAVKLPEGKKGKEGLVIFGDMKIPTYGVSELGDPKAKNKKFKNYINDLSRTEDKQTNIIDKGLELVNTPVADSFDRLRFSSGKAMVEGGNMKLKDIAQKKKIAAGIQNAILETAEEFGLKSDELAKGNIRKDRKAKTAQYGGIYGVSSRAFPSMPVNIPPGLSGQLSLPQLSASAPFSEANLYGGMTPIQVNDPLPSTNAGLGPFGNQTNFGEMREDGFAGNTEPAPSGKADWMSIVNSVIPYLRPSNQQPLDPNQLSGEMFALSNNQLEPVQAQTYTPLLENVSDISLQDQMNANQADFNSLKRLTANNPAAQATLAAQKYGANSAILGEQFRLNQANRMGTFNRNRATLNDATLKNLAILDQQYTRQAGAKSATKATAQAALSSIADKIAKNKLENRTLGIYENLYNYRFGPQGNAFNMNPFAQFNIPTAGSLSTYTGNENTMTMEELQTNYDNLGRVIGQRKKERTTTTPDKKEKNGGFVKATKYL